MNGFIPEGEESFRRDGSKSNWPLSPSRSEIHSTHAQGGSFAQQWTRGGTSFGVKIQVQQYILHELEMYLHQNAITMAAWGNSGRSSTEPSHLRNLDIPDINSAAERRFCVVYLRDTQYVLVPDNLALERRADDTRMSQSSNISENTLKRSLSTKSIAYKRILVPT